MNSIQSVNFNKKRALVRVDFNVPLNEDLEVTDLTRITAAKPTILKILEDGGSCIIMSHLGRPGGEFDEKLSLKHLVKPIENCIGVTTKFVDTPVGEKAEQAVADLKRGEILLLENLRFYKEETTGDKDFAKALSKLGDIYVNDAFGTAHRAHASTTVIAQFFKESKYFGLLLEKEILSLEKVLINGKHPVLAILGGAKVSSKIGIIENILDSIDDLIIGGGMAFTFIKVLGGKVGASLVEEDKLDLAFHILKEAKAKNVNIHLPVDVKIADAFSNTANTQTVDINEIPDGWMGLDVGEKSLKKFETVVLNSQTILWNGPLGVFEFSNFAEGTKQLGQFIAKATSQGAFSLVGGGDSVAAVKQLGLENQVSYVSTGGGAMLESLEGKQLPGISAILN